MKEIIIDGAGIQSKAEMHAAFADALGFPDWYGNNMDALHDCLTDIREDVTIRIENYDAMEKHLPIYARLLIRVLRHACHDNSYLSFTVDRDVDE